MALRDFSLRIAFDTSSLEKVGSVVEPLFVFQKPTNAQPWSKPSIVLHSYFDRRLLIEKATKIVFQFLHLNICQLYQLLDIPSRTIKKTYMFYERMKKKKIVLV